MGLSVIPSPRTGGMECCDRAVGRGQSKRATAPPGGGVMTYTTRAVPRSRCRSCGSAGQAADVSIAQPVKDQFDEFSGRRNDADVAPAAGGDVVASCPRRLWVPVR